MATTREMQVTEGERFTIECNRAKAAAEKAREEDGLPRGGTVDGIRREAQGFLVDGGTLPSSPDQLRGIGEIFAYHKPDGIQFIKMTAVTSAAVNLANVIMEHTPSCADRTEALRCVRQAAMWAKAAISLNGISLR